MTDREATLYRDASTLAAGLIGSRRLDLVGGWCRPDPVDGSDVASILVVVLRRLRIIDQAAAALAAEAVDDVLARRGRRTVAGAE